MTGFLHWLEAHLKERGDEDYYEYIGRVCRFFLYLYCGVGFMAGSIAGFVAITWPY